MSILRRPSKADLARLGSAMNLNLSEQELDHFSELVDETLTDYDRIENLPDPVHSNVPAIRIVGGRPSSADDPHNAVVRTVSVKLPDVTGPLSGKRIGAKDTISIAGVPMSCGSRLLYDYTPTEDATVVERVLRAGGEITAVLNTDDFAFSGGGHTSAYGVTFNPRDGSSMAGGSSCGSAAAVVDGIVDIALGGDQGGSIRIPASWSGLVGHKPTHGLAPYTGIVGFDQSIDHVGPMTATVSDAALLLAVIAGKDTVRNDPRQPDTVPTEDYAAALTGDIKGVRIAVVAEGFGAKDSDPYVDQTVRDAIAVLQKLGAEVHEVSVPDHAVAKYQWTAVAGEGGVDSFYHGHHAYQTKGWYDPRLISAMKRGIKTNGGDFSETVKMGVLVAAYMQEQYNGTFYARGRNFANSLTADYDRLFETYDLAVMPTTRMRAHELPDLRDRRAVVRQALDMTSNTCVFDLTGHPSVSVPCKNVDGLPIGLMLTGPYFSDARVLNAAYAYEQA